MVIIFLLAVFMLAQFFLQQILEGRDKTVDNLESNLAVYERQLQAERSAKRELQLEMTRLTADVDVLREEREILLSDREEAESDAFDLGQQLVQALEQANALRTEIDTRDTTIQSERLRAIDLANELTRAQEDFAAERSTVQEQMAELAQLRLDIEALKLTRNSLEEQIAELAAAAAVQQEQAAARQDALALETAARVAADARVSQLSTQFVTLSTQIGSLEGAIEAREGVIREQQGAIADLALQLNQALDAAATPLDTLRLSWLEALRNQVDQTSGVRIANDRVVVATKNLFVDTSAQISAFGNEIVDQTAAQIGNSLVSEPEPVNWRVRIDHIIVQSDDTDAVSELAAQRLWAIRQRLISGGVPAGLLVASSTLEPESVNTGPIDERMEITLVPR